MVLQTLLLEVSGVKLLFQFWSFVLGSNEQQYARQMVRIRHGDAAVPMSIFMGGLVVASMAYMSRTLNSIGREDREEYLAKKFETGAMSKAVLSYMGMSGMFSLMFNHFGFGPRHFNTKPNSPVNRPRDVRH